jgi:uncharacterized protein YbjT (DUF2867 family)
MSIKILIMGATGKVGGALVPLLKDDPRFEIVAGVRSPAKAPDLGVPMVELDMDRPETLAPALAGVDRVFMLTGYTVNMFQQSKNFLNEAKRAGVRHIVHLGACGDDDTKVAHWGWQQFVERYIEWAGFTFTHLRPDIFMQNLLSYGGARAVDNGKIRHYVANARISWVDCDDVAAVGAECLKDPEKHAGKVYRLASDELTFADVARTLSDALGQPFTYEARPPKEFMERVLAAGADAAYMQSAYENYSLYTDGHNPEPGAGFEVMNAILGRPGIKWSEFAKRHAQHFEY